MLSKTCIASLRKRTGGMLAMMKALHKPVVGIVHRGIDDCRNIAIQMLKDRWVPQKTGWKDKLPKQIPLNRNTMKFTLFMDKEGKLSLQEPESLEGYTPYRLFQEDDDDTGVKVVLFSNNPETNYDPDTLILTDDIQILPPLSYKCQALICRQSYPDFVLQPPQILPEVKDGETTIMYLHNTGKLPAESHYCDMGCTSEVCVCPYVRTANIDGLEPTCYAGGIPVFAQTQQDVDLLLSALDTPMLISHKVPNLNYLKAITGNKCSEEEYNALYCQSNSKTVWVINKSDKELFTLPFYDENAEEYINVARYLACKRGEYQVLAGKVNTLLKAACCSNLCFCTERSNGTVSVSRRYKKSIPSKGVKVPDLKVTREELIFPNRESLLNALNSQYELILNFGKA